MNNHTLGYLPALGWNSWNTFTWDINETLIKEIADCFVEKGYIDAGYEYIVIDDCWSLRERDKDGNLVADPKKFPNGMKAVADYIHAKGLKFGMYSCAGTRTCADYPGSFDHEYLDALVRYNKALQQRNVLLKQEEEPDEALMGLWEEMMAQEGEKIYEKRKAYVEEFIPVFQDFYARISRGKERVGLRYISHGQRGELLDVIRRDRAKDRIMGYSLHGVHKDDLEMTLGEFPIKREGSQGQNKTYLIALKLAQFDFLRRTGSRTTPLLLLDDIFDKLDADRVEQIVKLVSGEQFGQIFVTDTNRDHLDRILEKTDEDYKLFYVENGEIKA
mgnify:CR=1 FL=1